MFEHAQLEWLPPSESTDTLLPNLLPYIPTCRSFQELHLDDNGAIGISYIPKSTCNDDHSWWPCCWCSCGVGTSSFYWKIYLQYLLRCWNMFLRYSILFICFRPHAVVLCRRSPCYDSSIENVIYEYICTLCLNLYIYDIHMLSQLSHINTIGSIHCGCVLQGGPCLLPALRLKGRFLDAAVAGWNSLAIPESPFWVVLAIKLWVVHCFTLLYHITFIRYTVSYIWLYMMYTVKEHTSII